MRALLFHNSKAGEGHPSPDELVAALSKARYDVAVFTKNEAMAFAAELVKGPDLIVMAGGDGTVGMLLNYVAAIRCPIAVLPLGTSNNIARSFGIEGDPVALIGQLKKAPEKRLDIGLANGPWGARLFIESVGWGLLASTTDQSIPGESLHEIRVRMRAAAIAELKNAKARAMELTVDGEVIEANFLMVEATSLARVGPGLLLADGNTRDADALALVTLAEEGRDDMMEWLATDKGKPPVTVRKAKTISALWHRHPMRVDDEVIGKSEAPALVVLRRLPLNLRLLVPKVES